MIALVMLLLLGLLCFCLDSSLFVIGSTMRLFALGLLRFGVCILICSLSESSNNAHDQDFVKTVARSKSDFMELRMRFGVRGYESNR